MRYNFWIEIKVIGGNANVTVYINKKRHFAHMSGRNIWIFFEAPQQYIHHINPWKKCSNLMQFLKFLAEPFSRSLRSPRSNDLETKNDENFLMKTYEN